MGQPATGFLARADLQRLIELIRADGYRLLGPQLRDGALQFLELESTDQLPRRQQAEQAPGYYRLQTSESARWFDIVNGPQALKPLLFAPRETLWRSEQRADGTLCFQPPERPSQPLALLGVRSCDLAALQLQDRHFLRDDLADDAYAARRRGLLLVAVNCNAPADTCFCASTGDGPSAEQGYDLCLTELDHGFLLQVGSERGRQLANQLPLSEVTETMLQQQADQHQAAVACQSRRLPVIAAGDLQQRHAHPHWQAVAERCLACGNCTQVCPTCFCHREQPLASLEFRYTGQQREWDSCFGDGHAYLAGFQVRPDIASRYRQWLTHKLDSWQQQYGRSGCVGCGRCISWCPVGIDLVVEADALMKEPPCN
ncbi:4Fe-4S dicluster domain-containing protein [Marinobacterium arenosum]|uniref:4Fe-4S dicluster domain-containing protein n=1 Tax=Marinobacterium arenosum TaxID=2862496 RepID=UPI001C95826B|nr:4Fe-4S dicluster domain-containing protein [Marinobacterium arenosum]MBY4676129.1 4Fe-4S dicluster domain-containing protein [Marinobacterium arenosum]